MRKSKTESFLDIARTIAERSPCFRRKFGTVIVQNGDIIATGYNGTIMGAINCGEEIPCLKDLYKENHYTSYEHCPSIHAEENACLMAGRERAKGGIMYLAPALGEGDRPCFKCRRAIVQAGIKKVIYLDRSGNIKMDDVSSYVNMENEWIMNELEKVMNPEEIVATHLNLEHHYLEGKEENE